MKYSSFFFPGILLVASLVCLTRTSPTAPQEYQESEIVVLGHDLPWELRYLYGCIIDPAQDDIKRENYIWRAFELLKYQKYQHYVWFYDWLVVYQSGYEHEPGRRTPHGGLTPRGGPGGRTRGHGGPGGRTRGHGGPGGRTKKRGGHGPGGRTRGGGKHHGRH